MLNRIKKLIEDSDLSNGDFAAKIDIQASSLSHVLSGRNKPSLDFVMKVLNAFPEVDADWLLFGKNAETQKIVSPVVSNESSMTKEEEQVNYGAVEKVKPDIQAVKSSLGLTNKSNIERIVFFFSDGSFKEYLP
ncbi:MAG: hypothetical protein AUJ98_09755 [Bacteroidetes bacterium CG2_30_33_31]|nr:MAG: hypothetical protein AUJ98_09755 [Bacteroidetes bacterium CG2_30_33_31]